MMSQSGCHPVWKGNWAGRKLISYLPSLLLPTEVLILSVLGTATRERPCMEMPQHFWVRPCLSLCWQTEPLFPTEVHHWSSLAANVCSKGINTSSACQTNTAVMTTCSRMCTHKHTIKKKIPDVTTSLIFPPFLCVGGSGLYTTPSRNSK